MTQRNEYCNDLPECIDNCAGIRYTFRNVRWTTQLAMGCMMSLVIGTIGFIAMLAIILWILWDTRQYPLCAKCGSNAHVIRVDGTPECTVHGAIASSRGCA